LGRRGQAHATSDGAQSHAEAAEAYASPGAFDPAATRAAVAALDARVLLVAGELDGSPHPHIAAAVARLFPHAEPTVQPGAAHFPRLDDPRRFTDTVAAFLAGADGRSATSSRHGGG
jgi:pimeloyl-ACP methyl ester carboxylesterase